MLVIIKKKCKNFITRYFDGFWILEWQLYGNENDLKKKN
jgi:hypothetical protein